MDLFHRTTLSHNKLLMDGGALVGVVGSFTLKKNHFGRMVKNTTFFYNK
jgi:hypothetical protein